MKYLVQACTDIGNTKWTNQDSFSVKLFNTPVGIITFAIICDGMGGLSKGEVASASVVTAFMKWADEKLISITDKGLSREYIMREWNDIIVSYNEKLKLYGRRKGTRLGTTATVLILSDNGYYAANIGDTRLYEITDNDIKIITKDQTIVAREIEQGIITPKQAQTDPRRSVLLQCIGASDKVSPEFFFGDNKEDTVYMLCSDGFRHEITPYEIHEYMHPDKMTDTNKMKNNIVELIDINKQRGERDNISAIVIRTYK